MVDATIYVGCLLVYYYIPSFYKKMFRKLIEILFMSLYTFDF
jgi:hypothetical protein